MALFIHPDPDFVVVPLDGSDKYPPITGFEYNTRRLGETHVAY